MHSRTFFALLSEGNKQEIIDLKRMIMATTFPHLDSEGQEKIKSDLTTADDLLNDILEDEKVDDVSKVKDIFNDGN